MTTEKIYNSKEDALAAAYEFAHKKSLEGFDCTVCQSGEDGAVTVNYGHKSGLAPLHRVGRFGYFTLEKGDVCLVWDSRRQRGGYLRVFSGRFSKSMPLFANNHEAIDASDAILNNWPTYEKTGFNIITKKYTHQGVEQNEH